MKLIIDIPQGLKIDFENEKWTALTCMEMKDALMQGIPLPEEHKDIYDIIIEYLESHSVSELLEIISWVIKYGIEDIK